MNNEDQDFRNMKEMWYDLNTRLSKLEASNKKLVQEVKNNRYKSSIDQLIGRYRKFIILDCIMAIIFPIFILINPHVIEKWRIITGIYWIFFFLIEAWMDGFLLNRLKQMDIHNMTFTEMSTVAVNNWNYHKIYVAIGLPLAIIAIVLLALALNVDTFVIFAMVAGGIIGGIIGFRQLLKFRSDYRKLYEND